MYYCNRNSDRVFSVFAQDFHRVIQPVLYYYIGMHIRLIYSYGNYYYDSYTTVISPLTKIV